MTSRLKRLTALFFAAPWAMWPKAESFVTVAWSVPLALLAAKAWGKVRTLQDDVLNKAFPAPIEIRRKTLYLTAEQRQRIESLARTQAPSAVMSYYEGWQDGKSVGRVFFDTQVVRTMPMTFMAFIKPDQSLGYVEILSFDEPEDYLPRPRWLQLFAGRRLDDKLRVRWGIPNVTGSSLTCHAVTDGVRRLLAINQVAVPESAS